jgi:hypothetical protein
MSFPATEHTFTNQWGPAAPASDFSYAPVGVPTEPATPPQSPSGVISSESPNYALGLSSTENVLQNVLQVETSQQGENALTAPVQITGEYAVQIEQNAWTESAVAPVL